MNTEPLPGSLVTVTSPPIMRASLRVMASPRPVPPNAAQSWRHGSIAAALRARWSNNREPVTISRGML